MVHAHVAARLLPCLILLVIAAAGRAQDPHVELDPARFLQALTGSWTGKAERTPIGPRPYDITFAATAAGRVTGSAHPGRAIHHWTFYYADDRLRLEFLSTFAGNREPIRLHAAEHDARGVLFRARDPALLSVRVSPMANRLHLDVFHWDRPHVSIRLRRS